jgi:1,4-dihydroxy-2-naphthoyl-CoA synthase
MPQMTSLTVVMVICCVDRKAREIFFRAELPAQDAMDMGMVNAVIPHAELEAR